MPRTRLVAPALLSSLWLVGGGSVSAQDVKWRNDYTAARKESTESGRPLLLDFGTENCFWCKKLDATTFRDPEVVKLINEQFVPVKIDAQKYQKLTEALKIDGYPTLLLATPDGKVIGRHPGYADVAQLTGLLSKAPATGAPTPRPTEAEVQERLKAELDARLTALLPGIAAALDR